MLISVDYSEADRGGLRVQAVLVDVLRRAGHLDEADALIDRLIGHPARYPAVFGMQG